MRCINNLIFASIILILVAGCSVKFSYAVLTRTPRVIFEFQYEDARDFHDGMAAVKLNGRWGYINNLGQTVIPFNNRIPEPGNFSVSAASSTKMNLPAPFTAAPSNQRVTCAAL